MTDLPKTETLELEVQNGWLTIWFNQPDNRNALSDALVSELATVLKGVREDRAVRGMTLRGRGGVFCAGADLKNFKENFQASGDREATITTPAIRQVLPFLVWRCPPNNWRCVLFHRWARFHKVICATVSSPIMTGPKLPAPWGRCRRLRFT